MSYRCTAGEIEAVGVIDSIVPKTDTVSHQNIAQQCHDAAQYEREEQIEMNRVTWTIQLPKYIKQSLTFAC